MEAAFVTGYSFSTDGDVPTIHGQTDVWVVKLNNLGNVVWNKVYGGTAHETGWSVRTTPDGGCVVAGVTGSNNGDVSGNHQSLGVFGDAWVIKLDQQGGLQWQRCYGGTYNEIAFGIDLTKDGGYLVAGFAESGDFDVSCNVKYEDGWALKISSTGNIQWTKSLGGNYQDELHSIHELSDGSYIISRVHLLKRYSRIPPCNISKCKLC
jgi:hypothetical protein